MISTRHMLELSGLKLSGLFHSQDCHFVICDVLTAVFLRAQCYGMWLYVPRNHPPTQWHSSTPHNTWILRCQLVSVTSVRSLWQLFIARSRTKHTSIAT
jgi:hypothetical protein